MSPNGRQNTPSPDTVEGELRELRIQVGIMEDGIDRFNKGIDRLENVVRAMENRVTVLETKAATWCGIGGAVGAMVGAIVTALILKGLKP